MLSPRQRTTTDRAHPAFLATASSIPILIRLLCRLTLGLAAAAVAGWSGGAPPAVSESYDGPEASWVQPANPGEARVLRQERVRVAGRDGPVGAERVTFQCPAGYSAIFLHPIGQAPVLEEFKARVVYRGARAGAQLAVRVVFPRTPAAGGRTPRRETAVVRGDLRYGTPGQWQELTIAGLPSRVVGRARMMRAAGGAPSIDAREAYVDSVVLIVPGGGGADTFMTSRLEVEGVLQAARSSGADASQATQGAGGRGQKPAERTPTDPAPEAPPQPFDPTRGFQHAGKPLFPIIWTHRGESLQTLQRLGFNTVATRTMPSKAMAAEAHRLGLRIVAAPGGAPGPPEPDGSPALLGLTLPSDGPALSIDAARAAIQRLRADASLAGLPIVAAAQDDFRAWSRLADALVVDSPRAAPPGRRFKRAAAEVLGGVPLLVRAPLTRSTQAQDQLRAVAPTGKANAWRDFSRVEPAVWAAVASGASGVWLEADRPLGGAGRAAKRAAAEVELLNLRLALLTPWLVSGEPPAVIAGPDGRPAAVVLQRGVSKLVVGLAGGPRAPAAQRAETGNAGGVVLPSISESAAAFTLNAAGLSPLRCARSLGGVRIDNAALGPGRWVLLTGDRREALQIARRVERSSRRAVMLMQTLAEAEASEWDAASEGLAFGGRRREPSPITAAAKRWVSRSKASQAAGDAPAAYAACGSARQLLQNARSEALRRLRPSNGLRGSALLETPLTWGDDVRLRQLLKTAPRDDNLLAAGDFEDLAAVRAAGWRHTKPEGSRARVSLGDGEPVYGARCLTLHATGVAEPGRDPCVWVASPVVPLRTGQLVEITGWLRLRGSSDNRGGHGGELAVIDSLGGPELATRVTVGGYTHQPVYPAGSSGRGDWLPFRILRRATGRQSLRLTFALSGSGEASIDAVMVRPIQVGAAESVALQASARGNGSQESSRDAPGAVGRDAQQK
ncbi:MAG: hypothetical protein AAF790_08120 [Planctomycetota bacterium]